MLSALAQGGPRVRVDARLDPPFIVESLDVELASPSSSLAFNVSLAKRVLEYAVATAEGVAASGVLHGDALLFNFSRPVSSAKVWLVFRALNVSYGSAELAVPLPLAPLGVGPLNASFTVWDLPSQPLEVVSRFNVSKGFSPELQNFLSGNATVEAGALEVIKVSFSATNLPPAIERLVRVIVVEPEALTVLDNYTLVGVAAEGASNVTFVYAADLELKGVRGLIGPYPPTYYSFTRLNGTTKVQLSLLAPPYEAGDRTYVELELTAPLKRADGALLLPALVAVGRYVPDMRVLVKVRGSAVFHGIAPAGEHQDGDYRVYELEVGKFLGEGEEPFVKADVAFTPRAPTRYAALGALLVAFAAFAYLAFSKMKREGTAASAPPVAVVLESGALDVLKDRVANAEALLEVWEKYDAGKLSAQAYRQAVSRLRKREMELRRRCREAVSNSELIEKINEFDRVIDEIFSKLSEMEEAKRNIEKGALPRREGRKRLDGLRNEVEELLDKLHSTVQG